jgi:predicted RNase H-related nuclease YkuK (DUF458 family)
MWKTLSEVRIADILQFVRDASRDGQAVHVGTDSLQSGSFTQLVTVVVILEGQPEYTQAAQVLSDAAALASVLARRCEELSRILGQTQDPGDSMEWSV